MNTSNTRPLYLRILLYSLLLLGFSACRDSKSTRQFKELQYTFEEIKKPLVSDYDAYINRIESFISVSRAYLETNGAAQNKSILQHQIDSCKEIIKSVNIEKAAFADIEPVLKPNYTVETEAIATINAIHTFLNQYKNSIKLNQLQAKSDEITMDLFNKKCEGDLKTGAQISDALTFANNTVLKHLFLQNNINYVQSRIAHLSEMNKEFFESDFEKRYNNLYAEMSRKAGNSVIQPIIMDSIQKNPPPKVISTKTDGDKDAHNVKVTRVYEIIDIDGFIKKVTVTGSIKGSADSGITVYISEPIVEDQ